MGEFNKRNNVRHILKFVYVTIFILTPLISAILFCLKDGKLISDVYIPLSGWSDEITYYKQIEGILSHGMPKGYFGYNQSKALYGPLGVWGIIPLVPYVIWGFFCGWGYVSPIYANIFLSVIAFGVIFLVLKPSRKSMGAFSLFWITCHFLNRYVLSGVVEASIIMQLVVVIACGEYLLSENVREQKERSFSWRKDSSALIVCTFMICMLTLARPYFAVLYLIPFWKAVKDKKWGWIISLPLLACVIIILFFVNSFYFCSTYFTNIFSFESLKSAGISGVYSLIYNNIVEIMKLIWYAIRYKDSVGWYYILLFLELAIMILKCIYGIIKKKKIPDIYIITVVGEVLILISFMLMYSVNVGARHILSLIVANALILIIESHCAWGVVLAIVSACSIILAGGFLDNSYRTAEYSEFMEDLRLQFAENVIVTDELSYDNVVGIATADTDENNSENKVSAYYGLMFALPAGVGVSLDFEDFYENPDNVKARYILVHPDGKIKTTLEKSGMECVIEGEDFLLYKKRKNN